MIQIVSIRSFLNENDETVVFDKLVKIEKELPTLEYVLKHHEQIVALLPPTERFNLFYTIANCTENKREFKSLGAVAFDIDGINHEKINEYTDAVAHVTEIPKEHFYIVDSGNGLHFIVMLANEKARPWFKEEKTHYNAVCTRITEELANCNLPGKADPTIFEPRRLLRLPGTTNRKRKKPDKFAKLLQVGSGPFDFVPSKVSKIPTVGKSDQVSKQQMRRYPKTDNTAVMEGCSFLKYAKENSAKLDEPQWYAALSITTRLDGVGREISHDISKGHPSYSPEETDKKMKQAMEASGPRTCEAINHLWSGCASCPNYQKVESPIRIVSEDHIETELTGFHTIPWGESKAKPSPNFRDLIKFFNKSFRFKVLADSRRVFIWNGTHYEEMESASIEAFAMQHFKPAVKMDVLVEFRRQVEITNKMPVEWWDASVERKMNFLNGYLDIDTMLFHQHDENIAFRQVLPYEFDPEAKAPVFCKMLDMVTGGAQDTMAVLEEFMGYSLSNDSCWAQKALLLTGEGSNGKSTFIDTLKAVAGRGNYSAVNMGKIEEPYALAHLDKKLFNISEETTTYALSDSSTFKSLVTGQDFTVRLPYKEPFTISNRAKLILTCNNIPESGDTSHGFYRRLLIIDFKEVINDSHPDYDPLMLEKIEKELPGILNIALEGLRRLKSQKGFTKSKEINDAVHEMMMFNNTVITWAKESLRVHTNGTFGDQFTTMHDIYENYSSYTKASGDRAVPARKFFYELKKMTQSFWGAYPFKDRYKKKKIESRALWGLQGVELYDIN